MVPLSCEKGVLVVAIVSKGGLAILADRCEWWCDGCWWSRPLFDEELVVRWRMTTAVAGMADWINSKFCRACWMESSTFLMRCWFSKIFMFIWVLVLEYTFRLCISFYSIACNHLSINFLRLQIRYSKRQELTASNSNCNFFNLVFSRIKMASNSMMV